jgi:hypothetical protein
MWAKYKPVSYASIQGLTDDQIKSVNYGLSVKRLSGTTMGNPLSWTYTRPSGGASSPYRLSDFRNYNTNATPFLSIDSAVTWMAAITSLDSLYLLPNMKWGQASYEGQGDTGGMEILPTDLKSTDGSIVNFSNCYFGIWTKIGSAEYFTFSSRRISEAGINLPILVSFADANINLKNYMNSMYNNDTITFTPFISYTSSVSYDNVFSFPLGNRITITKSNLSFFNVYINYIVMTSSGGRQMGTINNVSSIQTMNKPYNSGETVTLYCYTTFSSNSGTYTVTTANLLGMFLTQDSSVVVRNADGSAISGGLITFGTGGTQYQVLMQIPAQYILNFRTDDGTSSTIVGVYAYLKYNNVQVPATLNASTRWRA